MAAYSHRPIAAPIWDGDSAPTPRRSLADDARAGIVVVGAGIAGLSTALHLAQGGADVIVLEAATVGGGATGTSAGIVAPQLIRTTPKAILHKFGAERGGDLLRLVADGGHYLFDLVARHEIDCDARPNGFLAPATRAGAVAGLHAVVAEWAPYRGDLSVCDTAETARLTGCRGYAAALLDRSGGGIDPRRYADGLATAANAAGVRLYENSPVIAVDRDGDGFRVRTATGSVAARQVVLAANGGNGAIRAELAGTMLPLPVCEVATVPLSDTMRAAILPEGHSLTDLEPDIFSIRYARGDRLVTALPAGPDTPIDRITHAVNRRFADMLTTYEPVQLDHVWHGVAWVNTSLLPRLIAIEPGLIAVQACNGRGLAINSVIGREVARTFGVIEGTSLLPLEAPSRVAGFRIARHLPKMLMSLALIAKRVRQSVNLA